MYSKNTQRILKDYKLLPTELCFCTMYLSGLSVADAYLLAFQPMSNSIGAAIGQAKKVANKPNIKQYITDNRSNIVKEGYKELEPLPVANIDNGNNSVDEILKEDSIGVANLDKQQMINELNLLINKTSDTKLKSELILKLADLSGVRKEQTETDDNRIYYYLPVTCNVCPKNQ